MTANVTSLAKVRAAARERAERLRTNNRMSTVLMVVVVVLIVIGLGATQSASSAIALDQVEDRFYFFKRQLLGVGLGTIALLFTSRFDYRRYRKLAVPLFLLTVVMLVAVLAVGVTVGGATRWVEVAGIRFQPSEFAKISVVLTLAFVLERKRHLLGSFGHFLVPVVVTVGVVAALIVMQPDLGTMIIVGAAAMAVIAVSDTPFRYVILLALVAVAGTTYFAFDADYRTDRIACFLDPYADQQGDCYQMIQGYYALANGGILGVGLGASRARWFYLPNAHTDFIFAIIGEETGLIGGLTIIALFVVIAVTGWIVAVRAPDAFGRMVAAGLTAWISFQALVNIGGVLGVLPITGIALPFVSYGTTALIVSMASLGILVNIAQAGVDARR
ncbi:MAG TPA: putative lipid II flippase FtsW [Acidimicrobiia bacterium]